MLNSEQNDEASVATDADSSTGVENISIYLRKFKSPVGELRYAINTKSKTGRPQANDLA